MHCRAPSKACPKLGTDKGGTPTSISLVGAAVPAGSGTSTGSAAGAQLGAGMGSTTAAQLESSYSSTMEGEEPFEGAIMQRRSSRLSRLHRHDAQPQVRAELS